MQENIHQWIADYTEGSISREDFKRLEAWIGQTPENKVIFEDSLRVYREAHGIGFMDRMDRERSWKVLERKLKRRDRVRMIRVMVAASVLLAVMIGTWLLLPVKQRTMVIPVAEVIPGNASVILHMADGKSVNLKNEEALGLVEKDGTEITKDTASALVYHVNEKVAKSVLHTVEVPVGGEFDLTLADGTRVWLNSDTKFRFPTYFSGETREVYVEGEAYFVVSKDAEHPFIVHTGGVRVKVLGTEFNLCAYPEERVVTTLAKGKVEVADGTCKVCLQPGEQAVYNKSVNNIEVRKVDAALYSSWLKGVFEFENMSLREIGKQLSRWYGVIFEFDDVGTGERRFTGGIKKYIPLYQSLDILEKTTNVMFRIKDNVIRVQSK